MASIISFTFREAVADVEYKGNVIRTHACGRPGHPLCTVPDQRLLVGLLAAP